jgi:RimJ/RimL family protein N-acetyltransferase
LYVTRCAWLPGHWKPLGYWFERAAWGHGYAFEAALAVMRFAAHELGLLRLKAGHAHDNPASGRILTRLGFGRIDDVELFSRPRNERIRQHRYARTLERMPE